MKFAKTAFASLVASGLVVAPLAAQAAEARSASSMGQNEEVAGAPWLLYLAIAAVIAGGIILITDDDNFDTSDLPASP